MVEVMRGMTIGKTAHKAGLGVETVRFYERKGLIAQPAKPAFGGFRVHPAEAARRIRFVRQAQELGFRLRETDALRSPRVDRSTVCGWLIKARSPDR